MNSAPAALRLLIMVLPLFVAVGCGKDYCDTGDTAVETGDTSYQGARHRGPDHGWRVRVLE